MSAREEVARLLAEHRWAWAGGSFDDTRPTEVIDCMCGWEGHNEQEAELHVTDALMAEKWIDDRPVPCGSEAYIPYDYFHGGYEGHVRCGGYLGEGHVHEDSNTGYQWDDEGKPLRTAPATTEIYTRALRPGCLLSASQTRRWSRSAGLARSVASTGRAGSRRATSVRGTRSGSACAASAGSGATGDRPQGRHLPRQPSHVARIGCRVRRPLERHGPRGP